MKILVVEDDDPQLKLAQLVLSEAGHDVSEASNAQEAFDSIREDHPQLVLLDLNLPGIDGLAFVTKLKANALTRDILVVAFTACPELFPKAAVLAAGCDAHILKPINTRELSGQLIAVVGKGNAVKPRTT
jgi:two-component system cell cycle response regulator